MSNERPPEDSPEFIKWLEKRIKKHADDIMSGPPADFEPGPIFGDINDLYKTDAELFPDEIEEYTPEERRKLFKLYKNEALIEPTDNKFNNDD